MTTLETIMDLCCAPKSKNMLLIKTHFTYVGLYFKHLMAVILRNVFKRSNTTCSQLSVLLQNYILIFVKICFLSLIFIKRNLSRSCLWKIITKCFQFSVIYYFCTQQTKSHQQLLLQLFFIGFCLFCSKIGKR